MKQIIMFILILLLFLFAQTISRDDALSTALQSLKMTHQSIKLKFSDEDTFRLSITTRGLESPTKMPDIADSIITMLSGFSTCYDILERSAPIIDLVPTTPVIGKKREFAPWDSATGISPSLRNTLTILYSAFLDAETHRKKTFSSFDEAQLDTLLKNSRGYLSPGSKEIKEPTEQELIEEDKLELEEETRTRRYFTLATRIDKTSLLLSAQTLAKGVINAFDELKKTDPISGNIDVADTIAFGDIVYYTESPFGPIIIGGNGPTVYLMPCAIIIDLGGDDEYRASAGGTDTTLSLAVSIDISGNDLYWSSDHFAFGAGLGGIGVLVDVEGNDVYRSENYSLGTGFLGWGLLFDYNGDDVYAGGCATQGVGFLGGGIICDTAGNDRYEANIYSQGFGFVGGLGILWDTKGNDSYGCTGASIDVLRYADHNITMSQGFGFGLRPDYSGGVGILYEGSGNDIYVADIFGQGGSYWFALGVLYDKDGHDSYVAYQYAQGAGIHLSPATLVDIAGNDAYISHGVSQGCGHDLAVGYLNDRAGDDNYVIWDLSQGAGNANGIGIFIDEGGDDGYSAKKAYNVQGYGEVRREFGSVGLMLDLSGKDAYSGKGAEGTWWSWSNYGIGIDFPEGTKTLHENHENDEKIKK